MSSPREDRAALGLALAWASRVMAVSLEMVLPGLAGGWLDRRLGTSFLVIVGFGLGLVVGVWHLLAMVRATGQRDGTGRPDDRRNSETDEPRT